MDWTSRKEGVRLAIARAIGLRDVVSGGKTLQAVAWENDKRANRWVKRGWINLDFNGEDSIGQDEVRHYYDPSVVPPVPGDPTDALVAFVHGNRIFHVTCKCYSDDQTVGVSSDVLAANLRSRIRLPSVRAVHQAAGVAYVRGTLGGTLDYRDADSRMVSVTVLDLIFTTTVNEVDDLPEASTDWIAEVATDGPGADGELTGGNDQDPRLVEFDTALEEP